MDTQRFLIAASLAGLSLGACAADWRPGGAFVVGGVAARQTYSVTAGLLWPWSWQREFGSTQLSGLTEAYVSYWNARGVTERQGFTQLGVVPVLRLRPDGGRSPWFFEGGIGGSVMNRTYRTQTKRFGTTFNFVDLIGVGRSFGADRRHELGLRITHFSNADIKQPNPGENFVQLRYAVRF